MSANRGKVYLIGAGPGDPELITLRGRELIEQADVILHDYLANPKLLDWASPQAEKRSVGKQPNRHSIPQDSIGEILVDRAKKGLRVVRLKGGDPFVFGRGGEEIASLEAANIPFEIVPGVTAGLAAAAYAGIPLSHRDYSSSITFLTGHENPEKHTLSIDFKRYGNIPGTLCIYMGIGQLRHILHQLREGGMSGSTPVGVIQWATLNRQRSIYGTVDSIAEDIEAASVGRPAMIIIGEAVARRSSNDWFENRPLFGKRIVVTRAQEQAGQLTRMLEAQGADVLELPLIEVKKDMNRDRLTEVFAEIAIYEWIVFTSVNGVKIFFDLFYKAYDDARCLGPMRVAAVGPATVREIGKYHIKVDLVPDKFHADALADKLIGEKSIENVKVLVVTGDRNREALARRLEEEGRAIVDTLPLYKTDSTDIANHTAAERYRKEGADAVLFTSASTVHSFVDQRSSLKTGAGARKPVYGSIGPFTTKTLEALELPVAFQSPQSNIKHFIVETISHLTK